MHAAPDSMHAAIDLGFGYVKLTLASDPSTQDAPRCLSFPSIAATSSADYKAMQQAGIGNLNVVEVTVGKQAFQVGPDVQSCVSGKDRRVTNDHFFETDNYKALYLGALAYVMAEQPAKATLSILVVGLPLTVYDRASLRDDITSWLTGTHDLPHPGGSGARRTVEVQECVVVPQTVGSLFSLAASQGQKAFEEMNSGTNLLVDVGYGTLMWMVSNGLTPSLTLSGANMGGAHTLLNKVFSVVAPSMADKPLALSRLDNELRSLLGQPSEASLERLALASPDALFRVFRQKVDMELVATTIQTERRQAIAGMVAKIDDLSAIDNVWLTGGACHLYADEVRARFPNHHVRCDQDDPRYSNLHGFHSLGKQALEQ